MALDAADEPIEGLQVGAVAYEYHGQARFMSSEEPAQPSPYSLGGQRPSPLDELYETVRVDELGREWRVASVDRDQACEAAGQAFDRCTIDDVPEASEVEEGTWTPHSWYATNCPDVSMASGQVFGTLSESLWDADDRQLVGSGFTDRQKKSVALYKAVGGNFSGYANDYKCTATVIDNDHILTAAHCVSDAGLVANPIDFRVCTRGNRYVNVAESTCTSVLGIHVNTEWLSAGDKQWDLAVLEVAANLDSFVGLMELSTALPGDIEAATLHNSAYPFYVPNPSCAAAGALSNANATSQVVKTRLDGASGHSGSAIYKCPGTDCESGEVGKVVAVWSGYFTPTLAPNWSGGSSVPGHQMWLENQY